MHRTTWTIVAAAAAQFWLMAGNAASAQASGAALPGRDRWITLIQKAQQAESEGDYGAARRILQPAARMMAPDILGADRNLFAALSRLGTVEQRLGNSARAEEQLLHALRVIPADHPRRNRQLLAVETQLVSVYLEAGQTGQAERMMKRVQERAQSEDLDSPEYWGVAQTLAVLRHQQGRWNEAEAAYLDAVSRVGSQPESVRLEREASVRNNLAVLYFNQDRPREAAECLRPIISKLESGLGDHHALLVQPLTNMAVALSAAGAPDEALPFIRRAWAVAQENMGANSRMTGQVALHYAEILKLQGRKREAREMKKEAERISSAFVGKTIHDNVVDIRSLRAAATR